MKNYMTIVICSLSTNIIDVTKNNLLKNSILCLKMPGLVLVF